MMQEDFHKFKGVKRSTHPINQDPEYLWDAHNIRFENKKEGTYLSITNETEPEYWIPTLAYTYVGHCVLGKFLILFSHEDGLSSPDLIIRIQKVGDSYKQRIIFHGNLGLQSNYPVLTLGVYENESIQKVYWVDGINPPRFINVASDDLLTDPLDVSFVADLNLGDKLTVVDSNLGGLFSPGVIQYAVTLYNKYGTETSILYVSPLHYIHPEGRGAKADELVQCSFEIKISCGEPYDTSGIRSTISDIYNFDYIRIYSIHRTSLDAIPTVKLVADIKTTSEDSYTIVDTGTMGEIVDPTSLLYIGGEQLIANCIETKDGTLFLGNILLLRMNAFKSFKDSTLLKKLRDSTIWENCLTNKKANDNGESHLYGMPITMFDSPGFKYGEYYRCGILLQYKNGKWSEPIFLKDVNLNQTIPFSKAAIVQGSQQVYIQSDYVKLFVEAGFKRIRSCVVFPNIGERKIITLGIIAPTVFSIKGRSSEVPYCQSSWFFRPKTTKANPANSDLNTGSYILFLHHRPLFADTYGKRNYGAEIQGAESYDYNAESIPGAEYASTFYVDENVVTMHSPEIEWDDSLANIGYEGLLFNAIGIACLDAVFGTSDILLSTPTINPKARGLVIPKRGYTTNQELDINGGLVTSNCFVDSPVYKEKSDDSLFYAKNLLYTFPVYPWHRSGSLNNDNNSSEEGRTRSAVLSKKCIGNLKYFKYNECAVDALGTLSPTCYYNIGTPTYVNDSEVALHKISVPHLMRECAYEGNIDTAIDHSAASYNIIPINPTSDEYFNYTTDLVRMKYKSSPHLVFSLGYALRGKSYPSIIPIAANADGTEVDIDNNTYYLPDWDDTTSSGETGGETVVTNVDDHIAYITYKVTSDPLIPQSIDRLLAYCPSNAGLASSSYQRFWRKNSAGTAYIQEDLTDKILTLGYSNVVTNRTKAIGYSGTASSLTITLTTCDSNGNKIGTLNIGLYFKVTSQDSSGVANSLNWEWKEDAPLFVFKIHGEGTNLMFESVKLASASTLSDATTVASNETKQFTIDLRVLSNANSGNNAYMVIGELVRGNNPTFGGDSEEALQLNLWLPASDSIYLNKYKNICVPFVYGDTWISRYDCLKTYPFTQEDENQIVEIGSFLLESRINMDGRCDRNRGILSITNMSPLNFNLFNPVYNQLNSFFNYRIYDADFYDLTHWKNQIAWSQEKIPASLIDSWTQINLINVQNLQGDKGAVTSIVNYNDTLYYFLEHAFGQILFNSRVQIPTSDGVPIEISNSYKVDGVRTISSSVGCQDKWAITKTPSALYFVDQYTKTLWAYGQLLQDFSAVLGLSYWFKNNCDINKINWNVNNGLRLEYDDINQDLYFATGLKDGSDTLCYSEKLAAGTGTYDYVGVPPFVWEGSLVSFQAHKNGLNYVMKHNTSNISASNPSITFISNANPNMTKIFDTLEFRGDIINDGNAKNMLLPFTKIEVENEYQEGSATFNISTLRKKFRVWRALLPRASEVGSGIRNKYGRARLRNPWVKVKLTSESSYLNNASLVLHDMSIKYTI